MKIIVCVKQVPATNEVKMDPVTNTIIREGVESILNPFDTYAIEEAIRIKEKQGAQITALSMGIPSVVTLLQEAVSLGVDDAILLSDRAFAGADTMATAYTLQLGVESIGDYDLILCGKMATDGDTAQVGPMLAEVLGIPQITDVGEILEIGTDFILCRRMTDDGYETVKSKLPAVITVTKEINIPRLPSIAGMKRGKAAKVPVMTSKDFQLEAERIGLSGSPTQVVRTFIPSHDIASEVLTGSPTEQAEALIEKLREQKLLNW